MQKNSKFKIFFILNIMEQKGITPKKRGKRKVEWSSKNRDQKTYLSVPRLDIYFISAVTTC